MAGGGKNTQTTTIEIPAYLQEAAQGLISRANQTSQIGYTPYYGPDVAAMTPLQQAAISNTNLGASAFGLGGTASPMAGMPAMQTFAGGLQGYSSGGLYDQALAQLQARNPGQFAALQAPFINPQTGAPPTGVYGASGAPQFSNPQAAYSSAFGANYEPPQGSGASRNYGSTAADRIAQGGGSTAASRIASSNLASRLPGGVNTRNPSSVVNRAAASLSKPQGAPTAANKPAAKSTSTSKSVSDSRSKAGKK